MNSKYIEKYAHVLTEYCCKIKDKDRVLIRSTPLAEPLILACQKAVIQAGGTCEFDISLQGMSRQFYELSTNDQLAVAPILYSHAIKTFDVIISIHAPNDIHELKGVDKEKVAIAQDGRRAIKKTMMRRSANQSLRWVICNYPTKSLAEAAKMSLSEYENFIAHACFLSKKNPIQSWEALSDRQTNWVSQLNQGKKIQFKSHHVDILFDIYGREWINSNGQRNMPSGEVFTSPHEASGNGYITFDIPSLLFGEELNGVKLTLKNGKITDWESDSNGDVLDRVFALDGARRIGEIAIGTNTEIQRHTLNTLYDEKIGGTIHMAIGASYPETGGKNKSSIHHDFITSFNQDSRIILDGQDIYKNGQFIV